MKKILLDTNAYSQLLRGDKTVLQSLGTAEIIYMSIFVLGELYAGFRGGSKERENKEVLRKFLQQASVQILEASQETSLVFAEVKHNLKQLGKPIPMNDVWIAAHALEMGAVLISYDRYFTFVPGLRLWDQS